MIKQNKSLIIKNSLLNFLNQFQDIIKCNRMGELTIPYFRELLNTNVKMLKDYCEVWKKLSSRMDIPEDVCDEIRTTIGLTNLLLQQKLKQYEGLIDDSEFKRGDKEITCIDLQGFWDMVYYEVEKVQTKFKNLEKCKKNSWVFVEELTNKTEIKKKPVVQKPVTTKAAGDAKAHALAARQRLAEAKLKMKAQLSKKCENPIEVEVASSIKNGNSQQKPLINEKEALDTQAVDEEKPQMKRALRNKRNIKISEDGSVVNESEIHQKKFASSEILKGNNAKLKYGNKNSKRSGKENISKAKETATSKFQQSADKNTEALNSNLKAKKEKEFIPLQCVTRAAMKAMLEKRNGSKN
ncbi:disks large-associated protein 5 [Caerostris darwini]|uniref:Disks large-associated protein 5 n=1 Tax=Caerostris darwini TaxID=1538125 RepID=A0AAV4PZI7_9ARAC|nr:disks large-associated protein 5 [Caerostris darwini]